MNCQETAISDVLLFKPTQHSDMRGFFMETFRQSQFDACLIKRGLEPVLLVQENVSRSDQHVLRGLHYQVRHPQGKFIRVSHGEIFDVAVDLRPDSPSYQQWIGQILSADNRLQMWIPPGFAHGFYVLSEQAEIVYKCSEYYQPNDEAVLAWNDPTFNIDWPLLAPPILSPKDSPELFSSGLASARIMQKIK
jgi:dTDP-4-dehydrorhamnose 3,5-epimerase